MSSNIKKYNVWSLPPDELSCTLELKCQVYNPIENPATYSQKIQYLVDKKKWTFYLIFEIYEHVKYTEYGIRSKFNLYLINEFNSEQELLFEEVTLYNYDHSGCVNFEFDDSYKKGFCFKDFFLPNTEFFSDFKIFCRISAIPKMISKIVKSDGPKILRNFEDYEKLLESEFFTDITLKFKNNKEIKACKTILAARSQVFSIILSGQENLREIEINDIDYEIMMIVLRFIYCEKIDDLDLDKTILVLQAAKYVLPELVKKCEEIIMNQVTSENVIELAASSVEYDLRFLKEFIVDFIVKNNEKFTKNDFLKLNSDILADIIIKIVSEK